jgi:uncharacterized protein involved in exopolysaccharide biosynthesis
MEIKEFIKKRNPLDYLKIFFRRKWLFITPVFIGLVLSIMAAFLLPPTFQSSTVILVEEEKSINPLMEGLAVATTTVQRMINIREQILGWESLVELTKKLNLGNDVRTQHDFEQLILGLRRNIVVGMRGPNIIQISYFGKDPKTTQQVAQTLTDILIEQNMRSQTKETDVAIQFINEQLKVYKRKIEESEIAKMEDQLKNLLVDSTEEHPLVKDLRARIAAARKELGPADEDFATEKPIANPVYQKLQKELDQIVQEQVATTEGSALAAEDIGVNDPNAKIYKLMLMDKLDSVLARDMRVNENIYNMLLQKLETAKITQRLQTSKEGTRYEIIDPPRLPLSPSKPNKLLVIFLGLFFGSCSGVGLVFGKEFMDNSFLDIEDAKSNLELPVLGAISRITTQEEIEKEKSRQRKIFIITIVVGGTLILITMFVSFFR